MKNRQLLGLVLSIVALSLSMFNAGLIVSKHYYKPQITDLEKQVEELEAREPIIVYQVDNTGTEMHGKITDKQVIDGRYTVTVGSYGKFLVTKEQYDSLAVGDEVPDYLKQKGELNHRWN